MSRQKNRIIRFVLISFFTVLFIYSIYQIFSTLQSYSSGIEIYDSISSEIVITDNVDTEIIEKKEITEKAPIMVDFESLLKQNSDVVGWIYCENTPINYPVLQSIDNNYYLRRMINNEYNISGSIFMDYRSNADFSSLNTIIYGHNMKNDSMFGTFTKYNNQAYFDEHPVLWFLTPENDYKIELIAGYVTNSTSDVYNDYNVYDDLKGHLEQSVKNSTFISNVETSDVYRIITLSTCSYEYANARYVLIGNLILLND